MEMNSAKGAQDGSQPNLRAALDALTGMNIFATVVIGAAVNRIGGSRTGMANRVRPDPFLLALLNVPSMAFIVNRRLYREPPTKD